MNALEEWLNKPRLFGLSIRTGYWWFHIISGVILVYGALSYMNNSDLRVSALIFGAVAVLLGVVSLARISPDFSEIIMSLVMLTMIGSMINFGRIDAFKEVVSTIGHGVSDGYTEVTTQAAGFGMGSQPARQPSLPQRTQTQQPVQQSSAGNCAPKDQRCWNNFAASNGYVRIRPLKSARTKPNQLSETEWCATPQATQSLHGKVNCGTGYKHRCVSCTK